MKTAMQFTFFVDGAEIAFVIAHPSQVDRFNQLLSRLCRYAARFGYNVQFEMKEVQYGLQSSDDVKAKEKAQARTILLCELLQSICDATIDIEHEQGDETYVPVFRYEPTFEFTAEDLHTVHTLAEDELQDYSMLTSTAITE